MDFKFVSKTGPERKVRVRFHYEAKNKNGEWEHGGRALSNISGKRIFTYAEVSIKEGDGEFKAIAGDYIARDPRDEFSKAKGRRLALQRAMWQIKDRVLRAVIWDEYFNTHSDGWNMMIEVKQEQES